MYIRRKVFSRVVENGEEKLFSLKEKWENHKAKKAAKKELKEQMDEYGVSKDDKRTIKAIEDWSDKTRQENKELNSKDKDTRDTRNKKNAKVLAPALGAVGAGYGGILGTDLGLAAEDGIKSAAAKVAKNSAKKQLESDNRVVKAGAKAVNKAAAKVIRNPHATGGVAGAVVGTGLGLAGAHAIYKSNKKASDRAEKYKGGKTDKAYERMRDSHAVADKEMSAQKFAKKWNRYDKDHKD